MKKDNLQLRQFTLMMFSSSFQSIYSRYSSSCAQPNPMFSYGCQVGRTSMRLHVFYPQMISSFLLKGFSNRIKIHIYIFPTQRDGCAGSCDSLILITHSKFAFCIFICCMYFDICINECFKKYRLYIKDIDRGTRIYMHIQMVMSISFQSIHTTLSLL